MKKNYREKILKDNRVLCYKKYNKVTKMLIFENKIIADATAPFCFNDNEVFFNTNVNEDIFDVKLNNDNIPFNINDIKFSDIELREILNDINILEELEKIDKNKNSKY